MEQEQSNGNRAQTDVFLFWWTDDKSGRNTFKVETIMPVWFVHYGAVEKLSSWVMGCKSRICLGGRWDVLLWHWSKIVKMRNIIFGLLLKSCRPSSWHLILGLNSNSEVLRPAFIWNRRHGEGDRPAFMQYFRSGQLLCRNTLWM